jgi:flagellar biosynthesis component FlhA
MIYLGMFLGICVFVAGFASGVLRAEAEQQTQEQQQLRTEMKEKVTKQMEKMGMQILTGETWQTVPKDDKISFVWGVCHVVTIEQALMKEFPSLKVENFSAKAAEGLVGLKINDIVREVDEYYVENPSKLETPVVMVIWDRLIKPKLKTGIAGNPLE